MKTPIPEILVFSRWFPPAELPPRQNISSDLVALALVVPSTHWLQAGRGTGREESELLRLYSPNHFTHTNHWDSVKVQDRQWFSRTTPMTNQKYSPLSMTESLKESNPSGAWRD